MGIAITGEMVGLFILVLGAIAGFWWRIEARLSEQDKARTTAIADLAKDLSEHKLFVAQNHVTAASLREAEGRLIAAIDKLATRLEAIADKMDKSHQ